MPLDHAGCLVPICGEAGTYEFAACCGVRTMRGYNVADHKHSLEDFWSEHALIRTEDAS